MTTKPTTTHPDDGTNYYEILEVAPDAPAHEIHKAYQRAKSTYSSDNPALYTMFNADEARELLRLIEEAYSILGSPSARRNYDDARSRGEAPTPSAPPTAREDSGRIASAHQALPDFNPPEASTKSSAPANNDAQTPKSGSLPPGMGRTSLSTYKIDENFEGELRGAVDFDGGFLQRIRLYKNISIDRMSEATRISRSYLMALETNDFKSLPAAVFVRGFVVQVARIMGLDEQKVANSYIKIFKAGGGK